MVDEDTGNLLIPNPSVDYNVVGGSAVFTNSESFIENDLANLNIDVTLEKELSY